MRIALCVLDDIFCSVDGGDLVLMLTDHGAACNTWSLGSVYALVRDFKVK